MPDPEDWLSGLDAPKALPDELRARLRSQLTSGQEQRPLDAAVSARLTRALTDPVADLLHDLDAPRPLSPGLRAELTTHLIRRRDPRRALWAAGLTTAAAVTVALVVLLPGSAPTRPPAQLGQGPQARPTFSILPGAGSPGSGVGNVPGLTAGQPRTPQPTRTPGPVLGEPDSAAAPPAPTIGFYVGSGSPASLPRTDGTASPEPTRPPSPNVSSRSPDAGPLGGGTLVRFRGSHLQGAVRVTFEDRTGTNLRHVSDRELTVVTPAHAAATVTVVIHFRDGGQFVIPRGFTYVAPPQLDSVSPSSGSPGGGQWVLLSGHALTRVSEVRFGTATAAEIQVVSDTELRVLTPAHAIGPVSVTATSPGGTSNGVRYLYLD